MAETRRFADRHLQTDATGRTVFYPHGPAFRGYVVTDPERERAIRAGLGAPPGLVLAEVLLALVSLVAFGFLLPSRPHIALVIALGALCALFVPLGLWWNYWRVPRLVAGLERVSGSGHAWRRRILPFLALVLAGAALVWGAPALYAARLRSLPSTAGTLDFYPGILLPLLCALFFGIGFWFYGFVRNPRVRPISQARIMIVLAASLVFSLAGALWSIAIYVNPQPVITISSQTLFCGKWRVQWNEITAISFESYRFGSSARLQLTGHSLNSPQWTDFIRRRGAVNCEVTGTNADYATVYGTIYRAWQAGRGEARPDR